MNFVWVAKGTPMWQVNEMQKNSPDTCFLMKNFGYSENRRTFHQGKGRYETYKVAMPRVKSYHPKFGLIHIYCESNTFHHPSQLKGEIEIIQELYDAVQEITSVCMIEYEIWSTEQELKKETKKS